MTICIIAPPRVKELGHYRKKCGLAGALPCLECYKPQGQYICPALPEIDFPFDVPENFTTAGPILLPAKAVSEVDAKLAAWLRRGSTILLNLGTLAKIYVEDALELASGLRMVLDRHANLQVLWKLKLNGSLVDELSSVLSKELASGRVHIEPWLTADPTAILQSG